MFRWYIFLNSACAPIKQIDVPANVFFPIYFLSIRAFSQDFSPNDGIVSRERSYSTSLLICFQSCHLGFLSRFYAVQLPPPIQASQLGTLSQPLCYSSSTSLPCRSSSFCLSYLATSDNWSLICQTFYLLVVSTCLISYPPIAPLCVT